VDTWRELLVATIRKIAALLAPCQPLWDAP
jgi:hypothetical protein